MRVLTNKVKALLKIYRALLRAWKLLFESLAVRRSCGVGGGAAWSSRHQLRCCGHVCRPGQWMDENRRRFGEIFFFFAWTECLLKMQNLRTLGSCVHLKNRGNCNYPYFSNVRKWWALLSLVFREVFIPFECLRILAMTWKKNLVNIFWSRNGGYGNFLKSKISN